MDKYVTHVDLGRLDLIKIDVEGSGLSALRGAGEPLRRFSPDIICEVFPELLDQAGDAAWKLNEYLYVLGYSDYLIHDEAALSNIYFTKATRLDLPVWNPPGQH